MSAASRIASFKSPSWALFAVLLALTIASAAPSYAQTLKASAAGSVISPQTSANLLRNADLAHGAGSSPDLWRTEAWIEASDTVQYTWVQKTAASDGELIVRNIKPDDARWMQSLTLPAGLYFISAQARVSGVGARAAGATVSLMEDGVQSPDLVGTSSAWRRIGFYLKVGPHGADVKVALRLGGYSSLNTGEAFFRAPRVARLATLPAGAAPVFDLTLIRRRSRHIPVGRPWTLVVVIGAGLLIAAYGWRLFGAEPAPVREAPRAERRRAKKRGGR